jgi:four helix bundle protein
MQLLQIFKSPKFDQKTMTENIIETMTFNFALEIIKLCKKLKENKEYQFNDQLFRSGTSIGANVHEAESAFSKREFVY